MPTARLRRALASSAATLLLGLAGISALAAPQPLQPLIDRTPPGQTLTLPAGEYAGPARIAKPMTLDGGGRATLRGDGHGTVLAIGGREVVVRGLHISGSGESHDGVDAGMLIEGDDHRVEDNVLDDVFFGFHLKQANHVQLSRNRVRGKDLPLGMRGDALRLWNSRLNHIAGNRFERGRDLTFTNSPDNHVAGNQFEDGRYGLQAVFSPRLLIEDNRLTHTGTGVVILYSPDVTVRGNHIAHAMDGGGAGIVFKESSNGKVEGNTVLHCAAGLKVDSPPQSVGSLLVRGNRFAHNVVGLFFYGEAGGHRFLANRIEKNLTPVAISAPGVGAANVWEGNWWDDYQGFDKNRDGVGDTPHEVWLFADRIWMETPLATFFRNSPALELLDFLERLAPFSTPHLVLRDPKPLMRAPAAPSGSAPAR